MWFCVHVIKVASLSRTTLSRASTIGHQQKVLGYARKHVASWAKETLQMSESKRGKFMQVPGQDNEPHLISLCAEKLLHHGYVANMGTEEPPLRRSFRGTSIEKTTGS